MRVVGRGERSETASFSSTLMRSLSLMGAYQYRKALLQNCNGHQLSNIKPTFLPTTSTTTICRQATANVRIFLLKSACFVN